MINKILKYLILTLLIITPFLSILGKDGENFKQNVLSTENSFSNFGYWEHIDLTKIRAEERIESQKNLYRYVLDHLELYDDDKVLEVGSGRGLSAQIIHDEYTADKYVGLDASASKTENAKKLNQKLLESEKTYKYLVGRAENLPFDNASFTRVFSVEAAKHFYPFERFVSESERVLKQNGKIVIASIFAKNNDDSNSLKDLQSSITSIDAVHKALKAKGFVDIHIEPIGQYVFEGFDKWSKNSDEYKNHPVKLWKKAYDDGLINYYVISAYKPV